MSMVRRAAIGFGCASGAARSAWLVRLRLVVLLFGCSAGLRGDQREPAIELYGLAGGYVHGNMLLSPQHFSLPAQWRPQVGRGVLAPLGRRWGLLFDVTASSVADYWKWDGEPGAGPGDNFARLRRISLFPSLVRLWRRERFSIYAGFGPGWEHNRESHRLRPIVARDERGRPVLADQFENRRASDTKLALYGLRLGCLFSLNRRVAARVGYSYLRRYADERGSTGIEAGLGWRF
jgi:hypothetical protein